VTGWKVEFSLNAEPDSHPGTASSHLSSHHDTRRSSSLERSVSRQPYSNPLECCLQKYGLIQINLTQAFFGSESHDVAVTILCRQRKPVRRLPQSGRTFASPHREHKRVCSYPRTMPRSHASVKGRVPPCFPFRDMFQKNNTCGVSIKSSRKINTILPHSWLIERLPSLSSPGLLGIHSTPSGMMAAVRL
jgi:hypothetical protein